jgi:trehalose 6-phosphate synthase/phosphatase
MMQGYNATLTLQTDSSKKQTRSGVLPMKPMKTSSRIHPVSQECLQRLCDDPTTTLCIFSGSERNRLSQAFAHLPKLWIAAENGCFIRPPLEGKHSKLGPNEPGKWITMVETSNLDWIESVQLVFDYFCERTPRSYVETRETSLVWSYKYADPDFGRQQARDLLQHLWTGPISNAAVDVIQGAKSVEVRPIGVSKGAAVARIVSMMGEGGSSSLVEMERQTTIDTISTSNQKMVNSKRTFVFDDDANRTDDFPDFQSSVVHGNEGRESKLQTEGRQMSTSTLERREIDFVMCCGHFLGRDEDIFEYIDRCSTALFGSDDTPPVQPVSNSKGKFGGGTADSKLAKGKVKAGVDGRNAAADDDIKDVGSSGVFLSGRGSDESKQFSSEDGPPNIVTTFGTPITCTVGRKRSDAGYFVNDSDDIAELLVMLTNNLDDGKGRVELLQFDTESSLGSTRSLAELARQNSVVSMSRQASLADVGNVQNIMWRNTSVSNISENSSLDYSSRDNRAITYSVNSASVMSPATGYGVSAD